MDEMKKGLAPRRSDLASSRLMAEVKAQDVIKANEEVARRVSFWRAPL